MGRRHSFFKISIILLSCCVAFPSLGQTVESLNPYNEKYLELLYKRDRWPLELSEIAQDIDTEKSVLLDIQSEFATIRQIERRQFSQLESGKAHLQFLEELPTVAQNNIRQVQKQVVASGEFSDSSLVTASSLLTKNNLLEQEVDSNNQKIQTKKQQIQKVENSSQYRELVQSLQKSQNARDRKNREVVTKEKQIKQTFTAKSHLERRLGKARDQEEQARRQSIHIRSVLIPREETQLNRLQRDLRNQEQERAHLQNQLNQAHTVRDQANRQLQLEQRELQKLEDQLQNLRIRLQDLRQKYQTAQTEKEKERLQNQINRVQNKISTQQGSLQSQRQAVKRAQGQLKQANERVSQVERQVTQLDRNITQTQRKIRQSQQKLRGHENHALDWDRRVGEAQNEQLGLQSDIRQKESELIFAERELHQLQSTLSQLTQQVSHHQKQLNDYRITHIAPIEHEVQVLQKQNQKLAQRQTHLMNFRSQILREEANIDQALKSGPVQKSLVQSLQKQWGQSQTELAFVEKKLSQQKQKTNQIIGKHNSKIEEINKFKQEFRQLEQEALVQQENLGSNPEELL